MNSPVGHVPQQKKERLNRQQQQQDGRESEQQKKIPPWVPKSAESQDSTSSSRKTSISKNISDSLGDEEEAKVIYSGKLIYMKNPVLCTLTKVKLTLVLEPKSGSINIDEIFAIHDNEVHFGDELPSFSIFSYNKNTKKKYVHDLYSPKQEDIVQWVTLLRCIVFKAPFIAEPENIGISPSQSSAHFNATKDHTDKEKKVSQTLESPSSTISSSSSSITTQSSSSSSSNLPLFNQRRKLLVIINPFSGKKKGISLFAKYAKPILDIAHLTYKIVETNSPAHATKLVKEMNLKEFNEIACAGGDGILNEILNGLLQRDDWEQAIKTPIAVIPVGTSNAIAAVCGAWDVELAAFIIARGFYQPFDLFSVFQGPNRYYGILSINWAAVSDADHGTENIRFMGSLRNIVGVFKSIATMKYYKGRLKYVEVPNHESNLPSKKPSKKSAYADHHTRRSSRAAKIEKKTQSNNVFGEPNTPSCPLLNKYFANDFERYSKISHSSTTASVSKTITSENNGKMTKHTNTDTVTVETVETVNVDNDRNHDEPKELIDDFFMFCAVNVSHIAMDIKISPHSHHENGFMDIISVTDKTLSRASLFKMFLEIDSGGHIKYSQVKQLRTKAFMLEPITSGSYMSIDGECVKYEPVFVEVHPSMANLMSM